MFLKPEIMPIANTGGGFVSTHGSPWDYDRRVPILFWRRGHCRRTVDSPVETVDIMPTLAAMIGLPLAPASDRRSLPRRGPGVALPHSR